MTGRRIMCLVFLGGILTAAPGCAVFFLGGVGTGIYLATQEDEEPQTAPAVAINAPVRWMTTPALVSYTLYDAEGDPCTVTVEYAVGSGAFHPATPGTGGDGTAGLLASSGGTPHTFSWDFSSGPDLTPPETSNVTIRITACDAKGWSGGEESAGHSLGNAQPAIQSITLPSGPVSGTVTIEYAIADTHSDTAQIEVEFKRESDGPDWSQFGHPATPDAGNPTTATNNRSTSPTGVTHLFPWDSDAAADMQGEDGDVKVRIRASDDGGTTWGNWTETAGTVTIANNSAPRVELASVNPNQNGTVTVPYTCFDSEGNIVSILPEFREFGGTSWKRATAGPGTSPLDMTGSPTGTQGVFIWDSARDGVRSNNVSFRLTPSEGNLLGFAGTGNLFIGNAADAWVSKTPMPTARSGLRCASVGGKVYAIGGDDGSGYVPNVEEYDPVQDAWTVKSPMPTPRSNFGCAAIGGKIYTVGGNGSNNRAVEEYDPVTDTWAVKAQMPTARWYLTCAAWGGKLYALGGYNSGARNEVEEYDPVQDAWVSKSPLLGARYNFSSASVGGKIYAVGGSGGGTSLQIYDPVGDAWSWGSAVPTSRSSHTCEAVGGRVFVFGGSPTLSTVEIYDPKNDAWVSGTVGMPTGRAYPAAAKIGDKIYVVGGQEAGSTESSVTEEYTPKSDHDSWVLRPNLPTARWILSGASLGGKIFAIGGYNSFTRNENEEYDPVTSAWSTRAVLPTARMSLACVSLGGWIYAIGGSGAGTTVEAYDPVADGWVPRAPMPTGRSSLACAVAGGKIYAIGGSGGNGALVEEYDPVANAWSAKTSMPTARSDLCAAGWGGKVYVFGGNSGGALDTVEEYDPVTDTWATKTSMPTPRQGAGCAVIGRAVYVVSGDDSASGYLTALERYDPALDTWSVLAPNPSQKAYMCTSAAWGKMYTAGGTGSNATLEEYSPAGNIPFARTVNALGTPTSESALVCIGGRAYLVGGRTAVSTATSSLFSMQFMEDIPSTGPFTIRSSWSPGAALTTSRRSFAGIEYNGRGIVVGGFDASGTALSTLERYDPSQDLWTILSSQLAMARGGLGAVRVGTRVYIIGGDTGGGNKTGVLEVYNLQTDGWEAGPFSALNTPRSHFGFGAVPETQLIYVFGGEGAGGAPLSSVEVYDAIADTWTVPGNLPRALEGCLCLEEGGFLKLFGGEFATGEMSDQVLVYYHHENGWRTADVTLPYAARDLFGRTVTHSWQHRGNTQTDEFCLLGGGFDGTNHRDGFFRFYTR